MSTTGVDKFQVWKEINSTNDFEEIKFNKKTIYFNQDNLNVLRYLNTRKDASEYLCELVKKDLSHDRVDSESLLKEIHSTIKQGDNNSNSVDISGIMSMLDVISNKLDNIKVISTDGIESHVEETKNNKIKEESTDTIKVYESEVKTLGNIDFDPTSFADFSD